ncbi:hypothetical protein DAEQUDRAFT_733425 [Daedalea quercina L-15889]|uniref:Uncharacterized protein n=1 Tax=Daedalea quercina L-15889 TaxID=1314783 RepID=A0A165L091_9APHY|nr:hypothetical protein DAEQUDRAFT_733425 [Daedalea quercina L-15889]
MPDPALATRSDNADERRAGPGGVQLSSRPLPLDAPSSLPPVHQQHLPLRLRRKPRAMAAGHRDPCSGWDADESRASSAAPTAMVIQASDDERPHPDTPCEQQPSPPTPEPSTTPAFHPPMLYAPPAKETAPLGTSGVHPPMLPADVAREMEARKAQLRAAALTEENALTRRRSGARLRRYNPDYLLAARWWRTRDRLTAPASTRHAQSPPFVSRHARGASPVPAPAPHWKHDRASASIPGLEAWDTENAPHTADCPHCAPLSTTPSPSLGAHIPRFDTPAAPPLPGPLADWDAVHAHFAHHRASLAHLHRAAADAERAMLGCWALVEELLRQRAQGVETAPCAG